MKKVKKLLVLAFAMCMIFSMTSIAFADEVTAGSADAPIDLYYSAEATEVTIPANTSFFYNGWRIGGTTIKVTGEDAYVVYNDISYEAIGGSVSVDIAPSMSPMMPTTIKIGNSGLEEATFTVEFIIPVGSQGNPEVLEAVDNVEFAVDAGGAGYYYTYTATEAGLFTFWVSYVNEEDVEVDVVVSNPNTYAQKSIEADGIENEGYGRTEASVYVNEGDEIQISIAALPDSNWNYPAASGAWCAMVAGTSDNPVFISNLSSKHEMPAGVELQYAGRVGGTTLTIKDAGELYVVVGEEEYVADENGVIEVPMTGDTGFMAPPTYFAIGNKGEETSKFTLEFVYPEGSQNNPLNLEEAGYVSADIKEGNSEGYWITYTVPEDGKLTIEMYGASDADYNELGWTYVVNNMTTYAYGENHTSEDEEVVTTETLDVKAGDVIQVTMSTFNPDDPWNAPAGTVSAYLTLTTPLGTKNNPIVIEDSDYETSEVTAQITVAAGANVYYMGYLNGMTMKLEGDNLSVIFNEQEYEAVNGVVTVEFPASAGMGRPMPCVFEVVNNGEKDVTADIVCTYPVGHQMNPQEITSGKYDTNISEGSNGYYYTFVAPMAGKLTIAVSSDKGWFYCANNLTSGIYGDNHYYDDETVVASETITVAKGDEVVINVNAVDAELYYATVEGVVNVEVVFAPESGMYKANDGVWYYYTDGEVDTTYVGLAKNQYGWWYINEGKLDLTYTGMAKYENNWFYVKDGKFDKSYTGLVKYKSSWVYVTKGVLNTKYTGMVKYKSSWVYVAKGKLNVTYTGLVKYKSSWVYVNKGKLDATYTGMARNKYGWWYATNGKLDLTYTGLGTNAYGTWYMQNGYLDMKYSGTVTIADVAYEVVNGKAQAKVNAVLIGDSYLYGETP